VPLKVRNSKISTIKIPMQSRYANLLEFKALGLKLDMSRGKPSPAQLDVSEALLDGSVGGLPPMSGGTDCRNYGDLLGLQAARAFFGELLEISPSQTVVAGNSSLALMHDAVTFLLLHGAPGFASWGRQEPTSCICPVPGYDRHFSICESLGIRMINVPLHADGPDMDLVESLVRDDPSIRAMWCMPKYSNPTGAIYSEAVTRRMAEMPTAAPDFRLLWDDAYRFHHLTEEAIATPKILQHCEFAGHADRALVFSSTSKMTFASAGIAFLGASVANIQWWQRHLSIQTIGPDKINQLRHLHFLQSREGVNQLMARHRGILRPKFDVVGRVFGEYLGSVDGVSWSQPKGGYFIDLVTPRGVAQRTVELARTAGLTLTPAGASFPYGKDPTDQHIRIAPSFPALGEVELAAHGVALSLLQAISESTAAAVG
jgi:aspartate/methionine/tyrosine aminotransferase